jgi:hypothetical protein
MSDSDQQVGGQPLTQCPMCAYSLTGLPENHVCPECGFAYDETMRIWRAVKWFRVLYAGQLIIGLGLVLIAATDSRPRWDALVAAAAGVLCVIIAQQYLRKQPIVVVGQSAIVVRSAGDSPHIHRVSRMLGATSRSIRFADATGSQREIPVPAIKWVGCPPLNYARDLSESVKKT